MFGLPPIRQIDQEADQDASQAVLGSMKEPAPKPAMSAGDAGTADLESRRQANLPGSTEELESQSYGSNPTPAPQAPMESATPSPDHHAKMKDYDHRASANRAAVIGLDWTDPDYTKKLSALQAQHGAIVSEKAAEERANPWGSESNHPGVLGKIGHGLAMAGNIAGNALIPGVMPSIPGTQANINARQQAGNAEIKQAEENAGKAATTAHTEAEVPLVQAQTKEALANAESKGEAKVGTGAEEVTLHDLMTGENGNPRVNSATGKPYSYLEAYQQVKQAAPSGNDQPLGDKVSSLNKALERRWQVLNPGQTLPSEYSLPPNATTKDFDRIDKVLGQNESAIATQAQRDTANEARKQTQELARQNAESRNEQHGMKWVTYQGPDGRQLAGPLSEAKAAGATNMAELPAQEVRDVQNARHVVNIMTKKGDPNNPETMGVLQLIDSLDKDGKLGVLASRYNKFLTSGVGTSPDDDPRIITLINKNMLSDTGTMLAHFGASGGRSPQMLQHFLDLQNSGTMDGVTLRAGAKAIADYMTDRAMLPKSGSTEVPNAANKGFAAWKARQGAQQ